MYMLVLAYLQFLIRVTQKPANDLSVAVETFIETATLSSTYGPGFHVNVQEIIDPV